VNNRYQCSLELYKKIERSLISAPAVFFCQSQRLFSHYILPNIESLEFSEPSLVEDSILSRCRLYLCHVFLVFVSLFSLAKARLKKLEFGHYLIDIDNSDSGYDFRSAYILEELTVDRSVNFFHSGDLASSVKSALRKKNPVYIGSILFLFGRLIRVKPIAYHLAQTELSDAEYRFCHHIFDRYSIDVQFSMRKVALAAALFRFLKLKKLVLIDDSRHTNELILACNRLAIPTVGYMHGRFNQYHIGLFYFPFDTYFLWSIYFKDLILRYNALYNADNVLICGHPRIKAISARGERREGAINVLILGESNISFTELKPYWQALQGRAGLNVFFRGKPGNDTDPSFSGIFGIEVPLAKQASLCEALLENDIDVCIASHSTVLLESWLLGVPSIMLKSSFDYANHIKTDNLSLYCDSPRALTGCVDKAVKLSERQIEQFKERIWGKDSSYQRELVHRVLTDYQ
jgi:hypothetical protein